MIDTVLELRKQIPNLQLLPSCLQSFSTYTPELPLKTIDRILSIIITKDGSHLLCLISSSLCSCFKSSELLHLHVFLLHSISCCCLPIINSMSYALKPKNQSLLTLKEEKCLGGRCPSYCEISEH